jgi:hypothetical protein
MRSHLAPFAAQMREPDPADGRRLARESWHTHGLIMLRLEWLPTQMDRELLLALAETAHGRRRV